MPYATSLLVGLLVGLLYALVGVKAPAPPVVALVGLLGMLAGERAGAEIRKHRASPAGARPATAADPARRG